MMGRSQRRPVMSEQLFRNPTLQEARPRFHRVIIRLKPRYKLGEGGN